ncbi:hypothetical protein [Modicisalibacter coralii]|uniref:hypothetical protein n=1 Tax=Modicisalibacter coralii TaxID=2304602 RepID=UPI00100A542C|nr:hypothetical protein [Halomonas coralii]
MNNAISNYREAKQGMQAIIDQHMAEAFAEIRREYGVTPVYVGLSVAEQRTIEERYTNGEYAGCAVRLDGE